MEYVSQLREGILEAYTGIITGLKNTDKGWSLIFCFDDMDITFLCAVNLLLPHAQNILDLVYRSFEDDQRPESVSRLGYGLIGDLAETFQGQIKNLLLAEWIALELRARHRYPGDTKKTMRWAREVRLCFHSKACAELRLTDDQTCNRIIVARLSGLPSTYFSHSYHYMLCRRALHFCISPVFTLSSIAS
jgi:hypothetical protein